MRNGRQAAVILSLGALGLAIGFFVTSHLASRSSPVGSSAGARAPSSWPGTPNQAVPSSVPVPPSAPTEGTAPPAAGPNADPAAVAHNFINAHKSFMWSDRPTPSDAARERVRPWATARLNSQLGSDSSAGYLTSQRIAAHEVDTVRIVSLDAIDPMTSTLRTYLSLIIVTTTKDGASPSPRERYLQLTVVKQGAGWYVDKVQI